MNSIRCMKIVVIEDEKTIRDYIARKIEQLRPDFKVVGATFNGSSGLEMIRNVQPDAVFTDIRMPIMDGIEMLDQLRITHPDLPVVVLSGFDEFEYARQAMRYGVFEYMLKPLGEEALKQTLSKLADIVSIRQRTLARTMITSRLVGEPGNHEPLASESNSAFLMCLIGIGNLSSPMTTVSLTQLYHDRWLLMDWEAAVQDWAPGAQGWWLIDENRSNQKFLIVSVDPDEAIPIKQFGQLLLDGLRTAAVPYSVTVGICLSPDAASMWDTAQRMRIAFERTVVIGKSQVYTEDDSQRTDTPDHLIGTKLSNQIHSLLETSNRESLKRLVDDLYGLWEAQGYSQRLVERGIAELLTVVKSHPLAQRDALDWHTLLGERISLAIDYAQVSASVWDLIEMMLPEDKKEQTEALAELIEHYFREHFTEDISLEGLAKKFGFTSAYLSKIFRKYKNDTPLRFMIGLRIEEAKRLMREHPDLDSRVIAEMVGYSDQHYFSKVFKNIVGKTSTEFRQSLAT